MRETDLNKLLRQYEQALFQKDLKKINSLTQNHPILKDYLDGKPVRVIDSKGNEKAAQMSQSQQARYQELKEKMPHFEVSYPAEESSLSSQTHEPVIEKGVEYPERSVAKKKPQVSQPITKEASASVQPHELALQAPFKAQHDTGIEGSRPIDLGALEAQKKTLFDALDKKRKNQNVKKTIERLLQNEVIRECLFAPSEQATSMYPLTTLDQAAILVYVLNKQMKSVLKPDQLEKLMAANPGLFDYLAGNKTNVVTGFVKNDPSQPRTDPEAAAQGETLLNNIISFLRYHNVPTFKKFYDAFLKKNNNLEQIISSANQNDQKCLMNAACEVLGPTGIGTPGHQLAVDILSQVDRNLLESKLGELKDRQSRGNNAKSGTQKRTAQHIQLIQSGLEKQPEKANDEDLAQQQQLETFLARLRHGDDRDELAKELQMSQSLVNQLTKQADGQLLTHVDQLLLLKTSITPTRSLRAILNGNTIGTMLQNNERLRQYMAHGDPDLIKGWEHYSPHQLNFDKNKSLLDNIAYILRLGTKFVFYIMKPHFEENMKRFQEAIKHADLASKQMFVKSICIFINEFHNFEPELWQLLNTWLDHVDDEAVEKVHQDYSDKVEKDRVRLTQAGKQTDNTYLRHNNVVKLLNERLGRSQVRSRADTLSEAEREEAPPLKKRRVEKQSTDRRTDAEITAACGLFALQSQPNADAPEQAVTEDETSPKFQNR